MKMGVDYYPEHWDREMWDQDADLMSRTGIGLVRLAEFAWSRLEPEPGRYDFVWLDEAIDVFHKRGIQVVIGTPTCTPPNWLVETNPEVLPVDALQQTDALNTTADLSGYRLIIAPSLYLLDRSVSEHLEECVRNGATLIVTNRTGVKNMNNVCRMEPLPGPLAEAAGVYVSEYDPIGKDVHTIRSRNGNSYACTQWCDILELSGAEPVAWYEDDFFAGTPAATVHALGDG